MLLNYICNKSANKIRTLTYGRKFWNIWIIGHNLNVKKNYTATIAYALFTIEPIISACKKWQCVKQGVGIQKKKKKEILGTVVLFIFAGINFQHFIGNQSIWEKYTVFFCHDTRLTTRGRLRRNNRCYLPAMFKIFLYRTFTSVKLIGVIHVILTKPRNRLYNI